MLADFGLSCIYPGRKLHEVCGTVGYQAPEMLLQEGYSFQLDVWSAGVVLYELLTGDQPFRNIDKLTDVFQNWRTQKGKILRMKRVPKSNRTLIRCLLRKNPRNRPTAAKVLYEHYFGEETKHAETTGLLKEPMKYSSPPSDVVHTKISLPTTAPISTTTTPHREENPRHTREATPAQQAQPISDQIEKKLPARQKV